MTFGGQLKTVQAFNEDFEWYPTTNKIIQSLIKDIKESEFYEHSFLDIGAGNGKVIEAVKADSDIKTCYAIEKSRQLIEYLPDYVYILGVDFHKTTLIDKEIGIIFCNPPYSEYELWTEKIIKELWYKSTVYLVIPDRWQNSDLIKTALAGRDAKTKVISSFDFLSSEDRTARAHVNLVKITFKNSYHNDAFEKFFDENFKYPEPKKDEDDSVVEELKQNLIKKENFVETLCVLYDRELLKLQKNYTAICEIDFDILDEFEISKDGLIISLKNKIAALKKSYWQKLFDGMEEITKRLTVGSRKSMLGRLNDYTGIEFNRENVYAVVIWSIKNANTYFDDQFIDTYEKMVSLANVDNYKSNQRVFKRDRFRYDYEKTEQSTHYKLKVGHRIVLDGYMGLKINHYAWKNQSKTEGLTDSAVNFISDLLTIANNLGFHVTSPAPRKDSWNDSASYPFFIEQDDLTVTLFEVRLFQNGNMHLKINPEFVHSMNILHGKLKGWLRNQEEAKEELDAPPEICDKYFEHSFKLKFNNIPLLC